MKCFVAFSLLLSSSFVLASPNCTVQNLKQLLNPETHDDAIKKIQLLDKAVVDFHENKEIPIIKKGLESQIEFFKNNASPPLAKKIVTALEEGFIKSGPYWKERFEENVVSSFKRKAKAIEQLRAIQKKYNVSSTDCKPGSLSELGLNLELQQIDSKACEDIVSNLKDRQGLASEEYLGSFEKGSVAHRVSRMVNLNELLFKYEGAVDSPKKVSEFSLEEMEDIADPEVFSSRLDKKKLKALDDLLEKGPFIVKVKLSKFSDPGVSIDHKKRVITYTVNSYKNGSYICSPRASLSALLVEKIDPKKDGSHCGPR